LELKRRTSSPQGLYGSARASALSAIDRRHYSDAVIVADLSNDATYAEVLHETFGPRVIGLQISRNGDGMNVEWRPVKRGRCRSTPLAGPICSSFIIGCRLIKVRIVDGPTTPTRL
jgi:hypothetical protein